MRLLATLGLAFFVMGCPKAPLPNENQPAIPPLSFDPVIPELKQVGQYLPDSDVLLIADTESLLNLFTSGLGLVPNIDQKGLIADLKAVSVRTLGTDITAIKKISVALNIKQESFLMAAKSKNPAVTGAPAIGNESNPALATAWKMLQEKGIRIVKTGNVYAGVFGTYVIWGNSKGMKSIADITLGKSPALVSTRTLSKYIAAIKHINANRAGFSVVAKLGNILGEGGPPGLSQLDVAVATIGDSSGFKASVTGAPQSLKQLEQLAKMGLGAASNKLNEFYQSGLTSDNTVEAILKVFAFHYANPLLKQVYVKRSDNWLDVGMDGGLLGAYLAAVSASVMVPAFLKYERRAKTTEAIDQIDKMYKGSAAYFSTPRVNRNGQKVPCQFPKSSKLTPDISKHNCCNSPYDRDNNDRCDVNTAAWASETWSALNFQMMEQHYFAYEYTSSGVGDDAKFTASAYADLDCDGVFSTFERYGYGSVDKDGECVMKGSSAFYKNNETE